MNSISLIIAEGSAKQSDQGFRYHLEIATGSTFEVVSGAFLALGRSYITQIEPDELYEAGEQLAKSINAFRNTLD